MCRPNHCFHHVLHERKCDNLRDRGHTRQLIVHKLQRTRYSFLVRMLFDNIQVYAVIYSVSVVNINFVIFCIVFIR